MTSFDLNSWPIVFALLYYSILNYSYITEKQFKQLCLRGCSKGIQSNLNK